ncbi:hypothetical protein [Occultella gossypii]|uniref:Uncharacterized protein n=1 Tax=Occultella gossypii TaxID=2800820 RepID=A0ABS7S3R7_9MICO|nr:hypothetical protein [Occultella gossypii]MBZ2194973.1 hypothetical protein [Occultella gossypii]
MSPLLTILTIVGALAVLNFVVFAVVGLRKGWKDPATKRVLNVFYLLGGACAVLGILIAVTSGG